MTTKTWTIRDVLDWAARDFAARGIESARLDAELLVADALGVDRIGLYLDLNRPLREAERSAIRPRVARRRSREPVAYILGYRDFYGRRFEVTSDVLIPRPDTETLVEHALDAIPAELPCRVVDVGTGSGVIAITLAHARPRASFVATDVSEAALVVAERNAAKLGVGDRIELQHADLFGDTGPYDVIVSNPPYVRTGELETLQPEVRDHEPSTALDAGDDGLDVIRALFRGATDTTKPGAHLLIEIGAGQAEGVSELARDSAHFELEAIHPDLNRIPRVVHLRRT